MAGEAKSVNESYISGNLFDEQSLQRLVEDYPSHGFVIDSAEASELFVHVRDVTPDEEVLVKYMRGQLRNPATETLLSFLSEPRKEVANDISDTQNIAAGSQSDEAGDADAEGVPGEKESTRPGISIPDLREGQRTQ